MPHLKELKSREMTHTDTSLYYLSGLTYSAGVYAKQSSFIEDAVECRKRLELVILIQDSEICVSSAFNRINIRKPKKGKFL